MGDFHSPNISFASSFDTEPAITTSSPCFQLTGVATRCFAVSCSESITRNTSSKLRPVVIGPDKKIKLVLMYPMTTGRNFDEVLRVIDSLQLTAKHRVATPVNWKQGEDVVIAGSVSNEEAKEIFGEWKSPKPYIRIVPQPR